MIKKNNIDNLSFKNKLLWQEKILEWYHLNKRKLPWRERENQNFYSIWLSEIMLQQTGVKTVEPYYKKFLKKWPTLQDFSNATLEEIMLCWQGLGYYQRAKNIYKTMKIVSEHEYKTYEELIKLPGIGSYTAAAITAILYDNSKAVIDGNIKRILSRAFNLDNSKKKFKRNLESVAQNLTPNLNNRYYCQALMDLGATICKPRNPICKKCPVITLCSFSSNPIKNISKARLKKKKKFGIVFYINYKNQILLEKSSDNFLYGLMKFPCTKFMETNLENTSDLENKLIDEWCLENEIKLEKRLICYIEHNFTNFYLKLLVVKIKLKSKNNIKLKGFWMKKNKLKELPFSKLMNKVRLGCEKVA